MRALRSILLCAVLAHGLAQQPFVLQDGSPVRMRLSRTLSSADAQLGETVDFEVLEDITIGETTVIKRGGLALGTVTEAQPKRRMGKAGKLNVNIDHVRLANGEKVALRAVKETKGGSNTGKMTGAIVATSIVFFPAAPLFLLVKGKDITIPKGTEITAYVNGDAKLDESRFSKATSSSTTAGDSGTSEPKPLSNADVIKLTSAGLPEAVIVSKVKDSPAAYKVDTQDLLDLKNAGVSDAVIAAILDRAKRN